MEAKIPLFKIYHKILRVELDVHSYDFRNGVINHEAHINDELMCYNSLESDCEIMQYTRHLTQLDEPIYEGHVLSSDDIEWTVSYSDKFGQWVIDNENLFSIETLTAFIRNNPDAVTVGNKYQDKHERI